MRTSLFKITLLLTVGAALLLGAGCAKKRVISPVHKRPTQQAPAPSDTPKGPVKPKTYTINGESYTTIASAVGFKEVGLASWYGKDFHGRDTANGEVYDMYGMTAAHKLLPFNTKVRVTNLENGKSTVVRINDRGPFIRDRIIDLTYTAAQELDIVGPGTARVRVESLTAVPQTPKGDLAGKFFVQLGAFGSEDNAKRLCEKMREDDNPCRLKFLDNRNLWRVQVGPYKTLEHAKTAQERLVPAGDKSFIFAD